MPFSKDICIQLWFLARTLLLLAQGLHLFSLPIFPPPLLSTSLLYKSLSLSCCSSKHSCMHYSKADFGCEAVHMHDLCSFLNDLGPWFDLYTQCVYSKRANPHIWEGTVIKNHMFFCLTLQMAVENENLANPKADITGLSLNPLKTLKMSV